MGRGSGYEVKWSYAIITNVWMKGDYSTKLIKNEINGVQRGV